MNKHLMILSLFATSLALAVQFSTLAQSAGNADNMNQRTYFPGGDDSLSAFLSRHITWPEPATFGEATVFVKLKVTTQGKIKRVQALGGTCRGCDWLTDFEKEAVRVVSMMPKWDPAIIRGRKAMSMIQLPIVFKRERPSP